MLAAEQILDFVCYGPLKVLRSHEISRQTGFSVDAPLPAIESNFWCATARVSIMRHLAGNCVSANTRKNAEYQAC